MQHIKVIYRSNDFRIVEVADSLTDMFDLKCDCFDPEANPDEDKNTLLRRELEFERKVLNEGVYGYVLERWNPSVDIGWETVDACFGFVGKYDKENEHYIVDEMLDTINSLRGDK